MVKVLPTQGVCLDGNTQAALPGDSAKAFMFWATCSCRLSLVVRCDRQ